MKPTLKAPGTKRLKLKCDMLLSTSAFKFNLRRYALGVDVNCIVKSLVFRCDAEFVVVVGTTTRKHRPPRHRLAR
jgi:hypothetical protein